MEAQVRAILQEHSVLGDAALSVGINESLWQMGMTVVEQTRPSPSGSRPLAPLEAHDA